MEVSSPTRYNNNPTATLYYKKYSKILAAVIKKAKRMDYDKLILNSCNKIKTTWNIINTESGRMKKRNETLALNINGMKITDQQTIADTFNEHFATIADKIRKYVDNSQLNRFNNDGGNHIHFIKQAFDNTYPNMGNKVSTVKEIEQIIKSLKLKNSFGYDEISTKILKLSAPFISSPINYICNKMLSQGVFPDRLKYATVIPLHKKGDCSDMSNYRPISLLTSFSKIFETIMHIRILNHITKYNILSNNQYGFRKGLKTEDAIYKVTSEILNAMNDKLYVGGILCDLEKAFDCVNHEILLSKLKFYGINGINYTLYQSYLENRYIRTLVHKDSNNFVSEWKTIKNGVPQGSVLGPLLFLIYIKTIYPM